MASKTDYNNAPFGILELGATAMQEVVREVQQLSPDPLKKYLPEKTIPTKRVEVKVFDGNLRVTGIVVPGMPNGLNRWDRAKTFSYEPAYFRRGQFIDQETINYLSNGSSYEKAYGMDLIQSQITDLVQQGNMMLTVMRAQLLTGGINITDSETGVNIQADSGMDATTQVWEIGVTAPLAASTKWANPSADILDDLLKLKRLIKLTSFAEPDTMIINGGMHEIFLRNTKIKQAIQANYAANGEDVYGWVKVQKGKIVELMGMTLEICDTLYDVDNANGTTTRKFVMPINRAVLLTTKHPMLPNEQLGYTVITKGEAIDGTPGPWVRTYDQTHLGGPTQAPGLGVQFGMAALPVLYKPKWVHNIIMDTEANIKAIVGDRFAS